MTSFFDLTYMVARALGQTVESTATGGAAGTLLDSVRLPQYPDDYFNTGTLWVLRNANNVGVAPENTVLFITDFTSVSGTVACTNLSGVEAGDTYAVATGKFPLSVIQARIREVLAETLVPFEDTTSLDTAANQLEYALPTAIRDEFLEVWMQTVTGDTDANAWVRVYDWYISETGTGTAKLLVFRNQPAYPYDLKLVYHLPHPGLWAATDALREGLDPNTIALQAAYRCLLQRKAQIGDTDPDLNFQITELAPRVAAAAWKSPSRRRKVHLATLGEIDVW